MKGGNQEICIQVRITSIEYPDADNWTEQEPFIIHYKGRNKNSPQDLLRFDLVRFTITYPGLTGQLMLEQSNPFAPHYHYK